MRYKSKTLEISFVYTAAIFRKYEEINLNLIWKTESSSGQALPFEAQKE